MSGSQELSFRVKVCGVTSPEDARVVGSSGAEAVGLNFYSQSCRFVDLESARKIVTELPDSVARVGVFVNSPVTEIDEACKLLNLDYVQLHGDETPEFLTTLVDHPIIKALRFNGQDLHVIRSYLDRCEQLGVPIKAVLLDAQVKGSFGGTGKTLNWEGLADWSRILGSVPLILAGGLTPANVGEAIRLVRPTAVDTASGVEQSPGRKDQELVNRFVKKAQNAFSLL
jgi:phosphoribosylanthranilate isomerase